jgi:hypothetical protein
MYSGVNVGNYGWGVGSYQPTPPAGSIQPNSQAGVMARWKHDVDRAYGGYDYGGMHSGGLGDYFTSPFGANLYGTGVWRPY